MSHAAGCNDRKHSMDSNTSDTQSRGTWPRWLWRLVGQAKALAETAIVSLGLACVAWVIIAIITFGFRHPWATDTERLIHIFDALAFRKVPYSEMRER